MNAILSHYSALSFWCYAAKPESSARSLSALFGQAARPNNRLSSHGFESVFLKRLLKRERVEFPSEHRLSITSSERTALCNELGSPYPLHVLGTRNERRQGRGLEVHAYRKPSNARELVHVFPGLSVCSPELTFIQMSRYLSFEELVYLGFEMCGTFCIQPMASDNLQSRPPLCTRDSIEATLRKTPYIGSSERVLAALSHTLEGAASPPEAQLAMMLTVPAYKGGAGFKAPNPNGIVLSKEKDRVVSGKRWRACDLYWEKERVTVEYDSEEFHSTREQRHNDAVRRNALVSAGIKVLSVTPDQLQNFDEILRLELALSKALGIRRKTRTSDYLSKHRAFHKTIVTHCPQWRKSLFALDEKSNSEATCEPYEDECEGRTYGRGSKRL